jgi:hypothetical protein
VEGFDRGQQKELQRIQGGCANVTLSKLQNALLSKRLGQESPEKIAAPSGFGRKLRKGQTIVSTARDPHSYGAFPLTAVQYLQERQDRIFTAAWQRRCVQYGASTNRDYGRKLTDDEAIPRN